MTDPKIPYYFASLSGSMIFHDIFIFQLSSLYGNPDCSYVETTKVQSDRLTNMLRLSVGHLALIEEMSQY